MNPHPSDPFGAVAVPMTRWFAFEIHWRCAADQHRSALKGPSERTHIILCADFLDEVCVSDHLDLNVWTHYCWFVSGRIYREQ